MKFKKMVLAVLAAGSLTAISLGANTSKVHAATMNSIAQQYSYSGTTYLYKMLKTEGIKYNKFYTENPIKYRTGKPEGIVIHETATPGATAHDEAIYFNREWMNMYAYVHAFVDHNGVIQMMTPDYGVWGAGPMANDRFMQVELCEETDRTNFAKSINNDAIYAAKLLHRYNLTPTNATKTGQGTVWSHLAVSKFLGGTDHGDPDGYFASWGYSMDEFFDLIQHYYNLQEGNASAEKKPTATPAATQAPSTNGKTLMHDAYVYDENGKKTKTLKKAGVAVNVSGEKTINKKKYLQIGKNEYVNATNVEGTDRVLKRNTYIYDTVGVRVGVAKLLKGNSVKTYGSKVTIQGIKYYAISPAQFVKANNF